MVITFGNTTTVLDSCRIGYRGAGKSPIDLGETDDGGNYLVHFTLDVAVLLELLLPGEQCDGITEQDRHDQ